MSQPWYQRYLLPLALGILGLLLLARLLLADRLILVPEDTDVVILVAVLGLAMVVSIHTLVRISMGYLRGLSVQRTRRETLAEHARFLRRLDHELKNPLTTLRTGLKTMTLTELDIQQRQIIETMEAETLRLSRLVTDLRKLAELETQPLNLQPLAIEPFVAALVGVERERFETGGRTLTSQTQGTPAHWVGDEDLLALAIHNVLDNAYKYTHAGDTVHLSVSGHNWLVIEVVDSGIGIQHEALPHVWEELYRAAGVEQIPGSGTGLTLVKAIVERHGGSVALDSRTGEGTSVTLRLPLLPLS